MPPVHARPARRLPRQAVRRRGLRALLVPLLAPMLLAAGSSAWAAAFAPRVPEADPPTGDTAAARTDPAAEPFAAGGGIRWTLAPWRWGASLTLDTRWLRTEEGRRSTSGLVIGDLEFASYVWQPWFVQLQGGLGLLLDRTRSSATDAGGPSSADSASGRGITARASASVFPASRFPLEARFDLGDTRAGGDTLVNHFRTLRLGVSQGWRPVVGSDAVQVNFDLSRVTADSGASDRLAALRANAVLQRADHLFDLGASWSSNSRSDTQDRARQGLLSARHTWQDAQHLVVESLASWNDIRLRTGGDGRRFAFDTRLLQLSTLATWRPRPGTWGHDEAAPLSASVAVRALDSVQGFDGQQQALRNFSLAGGVNKAFSREWRANVGFSHSRLQGAGGGSDLSALTAMLMHTPAARSFGEWRWVPSASMNASLAQAPEGGTRRLVGLQGAHAFSRLWLPAEGHSLSVSLSQSLGALSESPGHPVSTGLAHSAGLYWQGGSDSTQSFASLSLSDSRTRADGTGSYQFINVQLSRRSQLSRYQSWSANLTWQASRSDAEQVDTFTGERRRYSDGWQRYASGNLSFESQRVFGVPRLRFTGLVSVNTQQLERRATGDIDAPLEHVTESIEARLDWVVGRIDTRLSARMARVDGRTVAAVAARAVRRF
jgi:hypothetical protein